MGGCAERVEVRAYYLDRLSFFPYIHSKPMHKKHNSSGGDSDSGYILRPFCGEALAGGAFFFQ